MLLYVFRILWCGPHADNCGGEQETFDEIDESEICSYWDYNVTALKAQLDTCEVVAETVRNMEVAIQKVLIILHH